MREVGREAKESRLHDNTATDPLKLKEKLSDLTEERCSVVILRYCDSRQEHCNLHLSSRL